MTSSLRQELQLAMQDGATRSTSDGLGEEVLAVVDVRGTPGGVQIYAGASARGEYVLAISTHPSPSVPVPVRLAVISAEFGVRYVLDDGATKRDLRVSLIRCRSDQHEMRTLFASFADELVSALPNDPSESDVSDELGRWLGLFWNLQTPPRTDVVGLVGELTLLHCALRPDFWVRAWHSDPASTIDFVRTAPSAEVEVKSTQSMTRSHTISAAQAFSPGLRFFASVRVDLRDTGITIGEYARSIADSLTAAADRERFWKILAAECGASFHEFMSERFVADASMSSLDFFSRDEIPRPDLGYPLPASVSGLTFRSDFSSTPPIGREDFFSKFDS